MKKRKPPILLLSILFILGGAMVVYGIKPWEQTGPSHEEVLGQQHNAPTSTDLKNQVSSVAQSAAPHLPAPAPAPSATISLKESGSYAKPKPPTAGTTNSQWYETGH